MLKFALNFGKTQREVSAVIENFFPILVRESDLRCCISRPRTRWHHRSVVPGTLWANEEMLKESRNQKIWGEILLNPPSAQYRFNVLLRQFYISRTNIYEKE